VRAPTLDGHVELTIPAWTNGRRLGGKASPTKGRRGDLLATIRIVLPETSEGRSRRADEEVAEREAHDLRNAI
jgi:DnaJ-class molecular chaperone